AMFDMYGRMARLEAKESAAEEKLTSRIKESESSMRSANKALASQTEEQLAARTAELQHQQRASECRITAKQEKAISAVSGEGAGVKPDVGGVKTDAATTKPDLEATKAKLERTIGDLGLQSGLIARTREDLDALRRRGERNYYEFALTR